jgi:hypothetical protein
MAKRKSKCRLGLTARVGEEEGEILGSIEGIPLGILDGRLDG